jgi:hypothetical protein
MGFMSDSYKGHSALNRTPGQQRNVQAKQAETNRYATQARLGGAMAKGNLKPPTPPLMNNTQFPTPSQGMKGALSRVRTATRLSNLLKRF